MHYEYKRQYWYWQHRRMVRSAVQYVVMAGAAALFSYLILQIR